MTLSAAFSETLLRNERLCYGNIPTTLPFHLYHGQTCLMRCCVVCESCNADDGGFVNAPPARLYSSR